MLAAIRNLVCATVLVLAASPAVAQVFGPDIDGLRLEFPPDQQDRRTLPDGKDFFAAKGTIYNDGADLVELPDLVVILRDDDDRVVYLFTIEPKVRSLEPDASIDVAQAVMDIPHSARFAEFGWCGVVEICH